MNTSVINETINREKYRLHVSFSFQQFSLYLLLRQYSNSRIHRSRIHSHVNILLGVPRMHQRNITKRLKVLNDD